MKSILFIDMLGTRRRWQEGGVKLSRSTFTKFKSLIVKSARNTVPDDILSGGIETDSAMIVCYMPIRLAQVGALACDPVHIRLPSDSVGISGSFHDGTAYTRYLERIR